MIRSRLGRRNDTPTPATPSTPPPAARRPAATELDLTALVADPSIHAILCCGSGGVGKTTTAAALGVLAADHGRTAVVLTIDPARRLADALGLVALDNTARRVDGVGHDGGTLDAMMLDMKGTFDSIVREQAGSGSVDQILSNPVYQALSTSFAGTQEYMAMERLSQLRLDAAWDLIIVDTPPSRSALDFLDAPKRLGSFLDGNLVRILAAPARIGGRTGMRALNASLGIGSRIVERVIGATLLRDVQALVTAFDSVFGGFQERADATYRSLQSSDTAFIVVTSADADALREAGYFVDRLATDGMPLAGVVCNRIELAPLGGPSAERLAALRSAPDADDAGSDDDADAAALVAAVTTYLERLDRAASHAAAIGAFLTEHGPLPSHTTAAVAGDIHDIAGLRALLGTSTTP